MNSTTGKEQNRLPGRLRGAFFGMNTPLAHKKMWARHPIATQKALARVFWKPSGRAKQFS
ncbi:hypothetical protein [Maribacter sp. 2307ULW6-5]|uniref:hypothetical protein n=1 Tax=Maribacter sp. 2307ULW6-5 TaxID=3386275 RepID=UPI0039BD6762